MFARIAIVNRGEPAVRLIRAVRELNAEHGFGIVVIALHTEAERGALFVRLADESVQLRDAGSLGSPYLDHAELERVLVAGRADAAWVGWGFVAEDPAFAELCARIGVTFIGPPAEAMRRLGDKVQAKLVAEATNVPVAPWSGGPVETMEEARVHATAIGYPMILKARSGGGGRGIRIVRRPEELEEALERTQGEALRSFGDGVIFMEHLVEGARHIEVQVIADNYGTVWAPGVRDCSIQRKNQKLIEESSSLVLTDEQDRDLRERAIALVGEVGYRGAGTVEFLYQPQKKTFAFLEVNTRLQVEHPITEATTGIDLVKAQILIAAGEKLPDQPPVRFGHAIEARLNAEDAEQGFTPAPGVVELLNLPSGPGIRVDTGIATGDVIPPDYDSMVAKIIAWGRDRDEALARLRCALRATTVVLRGGTTTKSFLLELLDRPELISGTADTGWLDRVGLPLAPGLPAHADVALLSVAVEVYESEERLEREAFLRSARGGRPRASHTPGRTIELGYLGQSYAFNVAQVSPRRFRITVAGAIKSQVAGSLPTPAPAVGASIGTATGPAVVGVKATNAPVVGASIGTATGPAVAGVEAVNGPVVGASIGTATGPAVVGVEATNAPVVGAPNGAAVDIDVFLERLSTFESRLTVGGRRHQVVSIEGPSHHRVEVDSVSHRVTRDEGGVVRSPAPAVVVAIRAAAGAEVEAGETLLVLESMKMETHVRAPYAGRVRDIAAVVNAQVDGGAVLLRIDRLDDDGPVADTPGVEFAADTGGPGADLRGRADQQLAILKALVTGYDVSGERGRSALTDYDAIRALSPAVDELLRAELTLLTAFADICELSRNRPAGDDEQTDERVHSPREYLHTYLRSLDVETQALPDAFRGRLSRALGHYGITDLEPSTDLEEAVFRIFLAQENAAETVPVIAGLLERWLNADDVPDGPIRGAVGEVLDRLISATQLRFPVIGDLARNVRFRVFDRPLIEGAREQAYADIRDHLAYLAAHPLAADRDERIGALVASPEPLITLLAEQLTTAGPALPHMLEAMTRRYYKVRTLTEVNGLRSSGRPAVTGEYDLGHQRFQLFATVADFTRPGDLSTALAWAETVAAQTANPANGLADVYLSWSDAPADLDVVSALLVEAVNEYPGLATGRRVTVVVCAGGRHSPTALTFRPSSDGFREERVIRGMHPLTGQRLDLWRLKNFTGTRMPSPPGVFLFHCVAPDNPSDERLVALAEVRDASATRDATGQITGFPAAERVLAACLDSIRRVQAGRRGAARLDANRIFLHVWPTIGLSERDLIGFARSAGPLSVGAGLEEITVLANLRDPVNGTTREIALRFSSAAGRGLSVAVTDPPTEPIATMDGYTQKVQRSAARGLTYPYEIVPMLTGAEGTFVEYDFDPAGVFAPVDRQRGQNKAGIITGLVSTPTALYPEGMRRVVLLGDPTKALGTVAVPECALVVAALDLADSLGVPVEWFALSSGATISMDSGTENMDGVARALRRLITFTQGGGEVNVVVAGINVGAQPYWNAEATMLQHTKGVLIMTPDSAMVLTGKHSLDYSGGVSAEDNFGIGGYDRVMGPNGQAQYWAPNLAGAVEVLFAHYDHAYIAPGERTPRRANTSDPLDRDVRSYPHHHPDSSFTTVGEIFADETNKDRKKPFDIRTVIGSIVDQDHQTLERWVGMADADTSVVVDAHLGGYPVSVVGIESRTIARRGHLPTDGPDQFTAGTLFPRSSKKTARAINAASGSRPLVVLANLSGFDGSPESLRNLQLEYGAEIGRAIVNFDGPIIFCVISRYHGGAFVVFSGALNDNMEVVAVKGSFASVIGGAPAAAVVFTRDVNARVSNDQRMKELRAAASVAADDATRAQLRVQLAELRGAVRSEKLGEVAAEFEQIHNIERAQQVGSVHTIIPARELRPYLIDAVTRGLARTPRPVPAP